MVFVNTLVTIQFRLTQNHVYFKQVADIPLDHPSCSKQHAALQYRLVDYLRPDGNKSRRVTPYVIDLNSANGTYVNNQKIESQK